MVGRSSVSIATARCYKGRAMHNSELVSYSLEAERVSLRNQKSTVLGVNYGRWKPVFRRVAVISEVRSFSVYLVVSCCVRS
jgi:hypothetical protein